LEGNLVIIKLNFMYHFIVSERFFNLTLGFIIAILIEQFFAVLKKN